MRLKAAWVTTATLKRYDSIGEFSDAFNTARVQVVPSKGSDATDNHRSVLRLPKPIMCSFRVNAARTDIMSMHKLMRTAAHTGPMSAHTTVS